MLLPNLQWNLSRWCLGRGGEAWMISSKAMQRTLQVSEVPKQAYQRQEYSNKSLSSVYKNDAKMTWFTN